MGTSLVPLRTVDFAALIAINLNMTRKLADLYGVEFKKDIALKIITATAGAGVSVLVTPSVEKLLYRIPIYGQFYAMCSIPAMFGGCTYAVGRMFANHFERGGHFLNASIDAMKDDFKAAFQNSREWIGDKISGKKAAQTESR